MPAKNPSARVTGYPDRDSLTVLGYDVVLRLTIAVAVDDEQAAADAKALAEDGQ